MSVIWDPEALTRKQCLLVGTDPFDLERLQLQNEIFADRVSFVGVAGERHRARIVTRQPHISGEDATPDEIVFLMTVELGFRLLPEGFSRQCLLVGTGTISTPSEAGGRA